MCIVEAMKVMNEIQSEMNGEIVEILVEDGDSVEYSQPLFKIHGVNLMIRKILIANRGEIAFAL